jgi:sugar lactone lactonase YvrE
MMFILICVCICTVQGTTDTTATSVYGQGGSFTANAVNNGGVTANSLFSPIMSVVDGNGHMYVSDFSNNRVLFYLRGSTTATRVYGQGGSFTSSTANIGGISATSLNGPYGLALDSIQNLYVSDSRNNRVLKFVGGSTTATVVYGQLGSFTTNTAQNGGITANSLSTPTGIVLDAADNLYVSDNNNNRVLMYASGSTTATRVYGQSGAFNTVSFSPITADSLFGPIGLAIDSAGNLYIVDNRDSRVLMYASGSTTATRVYGQGGSFITGNSGVTSTSFFDPSFVAVDSANNVYVSERLTNRALRFPSGSTTALVVYGQLGSFTSSTVNNGGVSANSLNGPMGINAASDGSLYICDISNDRVLYYPSNTATTTVSGGGTTAPSSTTCFHESTIITYKGREFTLHQFQNGHSECRIPHVVTSDGYRISLICSNRNIPRLLRLTGDHLVYTPRGLIQASDIKLEESLYLDILQTITCHVSDIKHESNQNYFGLNCLDSTVLANGIKVSTFGINHKIPALWMHVMGNLFGVEKASIWGDKIVTQLKRYSII